MKNKFTILVLAISFALFGATTSSFAAGLDPLATTSSDPLAIESKAAPSESYLSKNRRSIGASTDVQAISAPTRGMNRSVDIAASWGNPFLPGEDGWEVGETGNVGYPIGDASLPVLLSMLLLYFIYRGVSSTKRKNNF